MSKLSMLLSRWDTENYKAFRRPSGLFFIVE